MISTSLSTFDKGFRKAFSLGSQRTVRWHVDEPLWATHGHSEPTARIKNKWGSATCWERTGAGVGGGGKKKAKIGAVEIFMGKQWYAKVKKIDEVWKSLYCVRLLYWHMDWFMIRRVNESPQVQNYLQSLLKKKKLTIYKTNFCHYQVYSKSL